MMMMGAEEDKRAELARLEHELATADAEIREAQDEIRAHERRGGHEAALRADPGPSVAEIRRQALDILLEASRQHRGTDAHPLNRGDNDDQERVETTLTYRVTAQLVHSTISYMRSTILELPPSATVADVLQETASLWALDTRNVQVVLDETVVNPRAGLGALEEVLPPRAGPGAHRHVELFQVKRLDELIDAAPARHVAAAAADRVASDPQDDGGLASTKQAVRADPRTASLRRRGRRRHRRRPRGRPFFRYLRAPDERADAVRDLALFFVMLILIFCGYVLPASQDSRGPPLNDITVRPFARSTTFADIQTSDEIYQWIDSVLRDYLLGDTALALARGERKGTGRNSPWTINGGLTEVLGVLRVRQLRVRANVSCAITPKAEHFADACFANYAQDNRAVDTFGDQNVVFTPGFEWHSLQRIQANANTTISQAYEIDGVLATYPNSGYLIDIGARFRSSQLYMDLLLEWNATFAKLRNNNWIDARTSAVVLSWNDFIGSPARYESQHIIFEQRLAGQFVPTRQLRTFQRNLVLPWGGEGAAQALLLVAMIWLALQKGFHARRATTQGGLIGSFLLDLASVVDLLVLIFYIVNVVLQNAVLHVFDDFQALIWTGRTFYYPFSHTLELAVAQRSIINVVLLLVTLRIVFSLRLFQAGSVLLRTMFLTSWSIGATLIVSLPIMLIDTLLVWQLVGSFNLHFRSFSSTWLQLSLQIFNVFEFLQPTLLDIVHERPFVAWYTSALIYMHVFVFRYVISAIITVSAMHHFLEVTVDHRRAAKRRVSASVRKESRSRAAWALFRRVIDPRRALRLRGHYGKSVTRF